MRATGAPRPRCESESARREKRRRRTNEPGSCSCSLRQSVTIVAAASRKRPSTCSAEPVVRQSSQARVSGAQSESTAYLRSNTHGDWSRKSRRIAAPVGPGLKAFARGSIRTCSTWARSTPATRSTSAGSSSARTSNGRTWAAESRSHIASMSPVITKTVPSSRRVIARHSRRSTAAQAGSIRCAATPRSARSARRHRPRFRSVSARQSGSATPGLHEPWGSTSAASSSALPAGRDLQRERPGPPTSSQVIPFGPRRRQTLPLVCQKAM